MPTSTLLDKVSANPFGFWFGCLVWIPITIWLVSVIHWMVSGDIDAGFGLLAIALTLALGYLTVNPPNPALHVPLFILAVSMIPIYPVLRKYFEHRELRSIDLEQIEVLYSTVGQRLDNTGAVFRLCEKLYQQGLIYHALNVGRQTLQNANKRVYADEIKVLRSWENQIPDPAHDVRLRCLKCGFTNELDLLFCSQCRHPYLIDHLRGNWVGSSVALRFLGSWMIAMILLVGLPSTATALPPVLAIILIPVEFAVAGFLVWSLFVRNKKTPNST